MYKRLLLLSFTMFSICIGHAQQSNNSTTNQNIRKFIQIWGLVKYRSAQGIAGKFNADKVFLEMIDSVKKADTNQFNGLMITLSKNQGPKSIVSKQVYPKSKLINGPYLINNVNYNWVKDKSYSPILREQLTDITNQINNSGKHYYIPEMYYDGNLKNEEAYANYTFDNEAINLLALAKAWNAIEYLFPYKYVMDKDWKEVLVEMIPFFRNINNRTSYEKGILMLETAINDTHAGAFMAPGSMQTANTIFKVRYYPPFDYKATEDALIVTEFLNDSLAKNNALRVGDKIIAINGINMQKWLANRSSLIPASNNAVKYRELSTTNNFRGDAFAFSNIENNTLAIRVKRQGSQLNLSVTLLDRKDEKSIQIISNHINEFWKTDATEKGIQPIDDDITLISAGNLFDKDLPEDEDMPELSAQLKSKRALIFDMRKYPQSPGFFSYYLPLLLGKAPFAFARYYSADVRQLGIFNYRDNVSCYMRVPEKGVTPIGSLYTGQIIILVNEHTQSMGEWFTMMLRQFNNNTTVIGSQTAGADGDVKRITLPGDYKFSFTGNGIFYPDGSETQRIGIIPDIYFEPSAEDVSGTTDALLQRAIKHIRKGV